MHYSKTDELILSALQEDIGYRDVTTANLIDRKQQSTGKFLAKSAGIVAGVKISQSVFHHLDPELHFEIVKDDGEAVEPGDIIALISGRTASILTGERVALNFIQRLSGIATRTHGLVESIKYYKAEIVDTRKTTPGMRELEKYAVRVGGARNHRFGLYDGVIIKDNHIKAAGGIQKAVSAVRQKVPHTLKIEVEVENMLQLEDALNAGADIIMLDNMSLEDMKTAVELTAGRALLEASGGINEENVVETAKTGVDFISIGALTHSVQSFRYQYGSHLNQKRQPSSL